MKVSIVRCQQTEDLCPGTTDLQAPRIGKGAFETTGSVEIVGLVSCGARPDKRAADRANILLDHGAEAVVFASCVGRGNPIDFA